VGVTSPNFGGLVAWIARAALFVTFTLIAVGIVDANVPPTFEVPNDYISVFVRSTYVHLSGQQRLLYVAIILFGLVPISPPVWINLLRGIRSVTARRNWLRAGIFLVCFFVIYIGAILVVLVALPVFWRKIFVGGIVAVGAVTVVVTFARQIRMYILDYLKFRQRTARFNPQKVTIAEAFSGFATERFRAKYVDWLEAHSIEFHKELGDVSNVWPQGHRPQIQNDGPSVRLARLDAKWCGLE
jgi:O-antigen ligase